MPSAPPRANPPPPMAAPSPTRRWPSSGAVRSGSTCTCRSARCAAATATSTPTQPRTSAARPTPAAPPARRTPRPPSTRSGLPAGARDVDRPCRRSFRRRYADAAGAGRAGLGAGRDRRGVRARARRRGDDRGQPGQRGAVGPRGAAPGRLRPDLLRHAVRRPHVLATLDRTHDLRGAGRRRLGALGRLRPGQPGPDLRHAGGVAGRLGGLGRRRPGPRARPRLGVLADRRGGHGPGPPGRAG